MDTTTVNLTRDWTLLADGTQWVSLSLLSGGVVLVEQATGNPTADKDGHLLLANANITPPSRVFGRATSTTAKVVKS